MEKKIGQIIKERVTAKNMGVTDFAKAIDVERSNVYNIFRRDSIDTGLLKKIGQVLEYDFFQDLLEEDTRRQIILKSKIEETVYVPIKLSEDDIRKLNINDKVIDSLLKVLK
ncbi:MAG: transcriptional regulator [Salinivirgaceae bacterium]|nr:transcriptional regulator [Salinivirgaceae bacterium]